MKISLFAIFNYVTPQEIPAGWPVAPRFYDREIGQRSYREGLEQVELADKLGFDWISFSEHHYSSATVTPHPALTATVVASRVKRAKLAVLGHTLPLNNPVRVAEELAMVDNLSDGRLVVGFLRGTPNEYQVFGANPAETRERTVESMELILKTWTEPWPFSWEGRYYQYRTVSAWPRPLQQPYPKIYVLGGSKDSAEFAARHHLGLGFAFAPFHVLTENFKFYQKACAAAGWEPGRDDIIYRGGLCLGETDAQAGQNAKLYWTGRGINLHLKPTIGEAVAAVDPNPRLAAGRPRPTSFVGGPDTIVRRFKQCRDECGAGVIDVSFQTPTTEHAKVMRSLELFGKEVLPRIQEL